MNNKNFAKTAGASSLLGAAFIIGTFGLWVRLISPMFGNAAQTAGRFAIAMAIVGILQGARRKLATLTRQQLWFAAIVGIASFGVGFLFTVSANSTKIANSLSLMYAGVIISALIIGSVFLKERVTRSKLIAVGVALVGLAVYAQGFEGLQLGAFAAVGAGLCDSIAHAFRKKLRGADRNTVVFYQYGIGAVVALAYVLLAGEQAFKDVSLSAILGLVAYGIVSVGLGNFLLYGFAHLDVNIGAVILATQLFFAAILGMIFLDEFPALNETIGIVLIFAAAALTSIGGKPPPSDPLDLEFRWKTRKA